MNEFELIDHFFKTQKVKRNDVIHSIGDDCAVVSVPPKKQLAISVDTLVSGIHFFPDMPPFDLGYKTLAVNLSDLAAAGAEPAWATLSLTLPTLDEAWLTEFTRGLFSLAEQYQIQLIGGDTTQGPLSITLQIHGFVPEGLALTRHGAHVGDEIYVTGTVGDAGFALSLLKSSMHPDNRPYFLSRLYRPTPRIEVGQQLRTIASACIDISDGLAADLSHILECSHVGATIYLDNIPYSKELQKEKNKEIWALTAGDDFELCFTVPPSRKFQLDLNCNITKIGIITATQGLRVLDKDNQPVSFSLAGYDHFKNSTPRGF